MRVFVAVELPPALEEALANTSALLRDEVSGRFVGPDQFHVTLAFLGEVSPARVDGAIEAVRRATDSRAPFTTSLGQLGTFGRGRSVVLWQGFANAKEEWAQLASNVRSELSAAGFSFDTKGFVPHVTLMRNARISQGFLPMPTVERGTIDTVTVFSSDLSGSRPCYEALERLYLRA